MERNREILCFLIQPQPVVDVGGLKLRFSPGEVAEVTRIVPTINDKPYGPPFKTLLDAHKALRCPVMAITRNLNQDDPPVLCRVDGKSVLVDFRYSDVWESWLRTAKRRIKEGSASVNPVTGEVYWTPNTSLNR